MMRLHLVNETFSWEIVSLFLISIFMQESPVYQQRPELEELYLVVSALCVAVTLCCMPVCGSYSYNLYHLFKKYPACMHQIQLHNK